MADKKKILKLIVMLAAAVLIMAVGYYYYQSGQIVLVTAVAVEEKIIVETAQASGKVSGGSDIAISFQRAGQIASLPVKTGDKVSQGQVLASLNMDELKNQRLRQESSYSQAVLNLSRLKALDLPQARQRESQAAGEAAYKASILEKQRQLYQQGGLSEIEYQRIKKESNQAAADLEIARQERAILQSNTIPQGELSVKIARESLAGIDLELAQSTVKAPLAGTIVEKSANAGEFVQAGQVVCRLIPSSGSTEIEVQADERAFDRIKSGQKATVVTDALPGRVFSAQVSKVSPTVDAERGTFEVTLTISPAVEEMPPNLAVRVEIETGTAHQGLAIEQQFLGQDSGGAYVWIAENGLAQRQEVSAQDLGNGYFEIISGLQPGMTVIDALNLTAGQRVKLTSEGR